MCAVDKNPRIDDVADFYRVFRERIFMAKKSYLLLYASSILDFLRGPGDVKSQEVGTPRFFQRYRAFIENTKQNRESAKP